MLNIASADTADDSRIAAFGAQADLVVDNSLYQFAASLPYAGDNITADLTLASNAWICYLYRGDQPDNARFWHAVFNDTITRIRARLEVTDGSQFIVVSQPYKSQALNPDATQFRSTSGGASSTDDSDL